MAKPTIDRETITPTMARQYLEQNTTNRPLVNKRIYTIASAIKSGEWQENGETIKFNGDGTLIDGQHRLSAIIVAGRPVTTLIVRGLPGESQETIDIGAARTVGNMLSIRGHAYANEKAAAARILWVYQQCGDLYSVDYSSRREPTPTEQLQLIDSIPDLDEWIKFASRIYRADRALRISTPKIAAAGIVFASKSSVEDAHAFFEELLSPKRQTDATATLRKRLLQHSTANPLPARIMAAFIVKAWNHWLAGEPLSKMTWRAGGSNREEFPKVKSSADVGND